MTGRMSQKPVARETCRKPTVLDTRMAWLRDMSALTYGECTDAGSDCEIQLWIGVGVTVAIVALRQAFSL